MPAPIVINRLTTGWKISGTKNFRLASSKLLGYYGTNLQNPSDSLMRCVIPDDGCIFIQPDQAGAEALVVAYECRKGKYRSLFELGVKPHSYTALQIMTDRFRGNYPVERYKNIDPSILITYPEYKELFTRIKDDTIAYLTGKIVRHARNYDVRYKTFMLFVLERSKGKIAFTPKEAKQFLKTDDETFPEIGELHARIIGELLAHRELRNLFGYPRKFTGLWTEAIKRDAYAFIPQSTVGTLNNIAFTELYHKIKKEKLPWKLLNNKHDSLLLQVLDTSEHKEMSEHYIRQSMERELISTQKEHYKMKIGISRGYNWAKYHKDNNPAGMKEDE